LDHVDINQLNIISLFPQAHSRALDQFSQFAVFALFVTLALPVKLLAVMPTLLNVYVAV
jgi:hypothetical protein